MRLDQNVENKRPAGAYPLRDFHKICRVCTPFPDALDSKTSLHLLKGYGVMGVLSWWCRVSAKSSTPRSGVTVRQTSKRFWDARTCSRSSITMPSLVGQLGLHPPPWRPKRFSFLSVCPSRFCKRCAVGVRQVAPVVLRELYYLCPLKIIVRNFTQSHTTVIWLHNGAIIIVI